MIKNDDLSQFKFTCLVADIDTNDLWFGTKDKLERHNVKNHFWEQFDASNTNTLLNDEIIDIVVGQNFVCVLSAF